MPARDGLPAIIVVMGVSASGKSTVGAALAAKIGCDFEDGDDFHSPENISKMTAGIALTDDDRWPWLDAIARDMDRKRVAGKQLVIACSALKRAYRDRLALGHEKTTCFVYLDVPCDVLAKRISERQQHFMPAALLYSQLAAFEPPMPDENAICINACGQTDEIVTSIVAALRA